MIRVWVMFTCLLMHHYNKTLLIWLAMVTYWGKNNPKLYKLICKNLVIVDEYPVENAHNITRSKTNDHDSAEKMQETAKATFQSRQAQSNFRKYLQLRIIPCFHKSTLTIWNYVVLNCLQSVFQHNKIFQQCLVYWIRKKNNSAKCLWQRTNNETCYEVLPLEYASQNQPNSDKRCYIPGFLVSSDTERRVFEGCAHFFHLECLGDMDICLFCQSFLQNKARSLTETAENAILHPRKQASTN